MRILLTVFVFTKSLSENKPSMAYFRYYEVMKDKVKPFILHDLVRAVRARKNLSGAFPEDWTKPVDELIVRAPRLFAVVPLSISS